MELVLFMALYILNIQLIIKICEYFKIYPIFIDFIFFSYLSFSRISSFASSIWENKYQELNDEMIFIEITKEYNL